MARFARVAVPRGKDGFARAIGEVHRKYANVINTREDRKGYLWQGRFISYPLSEDHLFAAMRFVERNPVRAGLVAAAEGYEWSSAGAHVRKEPHPLLSSFPLEAGIPDWSAYLGQNDRPEDVGRFTEHEHSGRPLGGEDFLKRLEALTGRVPAPKRKGRKKRNGE